MTWKPDGASPQMEKMMEDRDVPEEDRDEIRRFSEVLRRVAAKKAGKELPPAPEGMREWIEGAS